ncbi:HET domain-containing protein [Fusarium sp. Ph1]|nr:HET domain-containing protein [Fusarium sp. Ph1]
MEPFDHIQDVHPPGSRRLAISIAYEASQEAFQLLVQALSESVSMAASTLFFFIVAAAPWLAIWYLLIAVNPNFIEEHWYLSFFVCFFVVYLAKFLVSFALDLFNRVAERIWGRAYIRRIPRWLMTGHLRRATRDLTWSMSQIKGALNVMKGLLKYFRRTETKPICELCHNLNSHHGEILMSYTKVLQNRGDCTTCAIISAGVRRFFPPKDTSSDFFLPWRRYRRGDEITLTWDRYNRTIRVETGDVHTHWPSLSFYCFGKGPDLPVLSSPKAYVDDTRSEASLHWMQSWIMKCTTEHEHCNKSEPQTLPDRVLDLGRSEDSTIKLLDTQNQLGYYACLSHRWGPIQPLRTLKENKESFESGIPIEALPKTFQEAVSVCRRLSLRYLWIDTLCIIQDSNEDKQRQLPKMASIFENCLLTIAATKAFGHQEGLHTEEDEEAIYLECIPGSELGHELMDDIWVRLAYPNRGEAINHWHESTNAKENEEEWPLLTRAWVFQERLLSPRMLHFAKRELVWECRTCVSCDCGKNHDKPSDDLEFRRLVSSQSIKTSDVTPMQLRYLWYAIAQRYSHVMGNLTHESDVFPALSGLASRISGLLNDDYMAGLWRSNIVEGLLWTRDNTHGCRKDGKPKELHAPSWSWASIVGEIVYQHRGRSYFGSELQEIYANTVNVYCDPTGLDRTGEISSAMLTLSGWTSPATLRIRRTERRSMRSDEPIVEVSHTLVRYHSGEGTRFIPDHPEDMIDGTVVLCMRLAKIGGRDWYMVLGKESPTSTNYKRLGLLEGENVTWSWFSPASWRRRAEERFYEEKKVIYFV